ncbi:MAG TPA: hypothetical protein VFC79_05950 [Tissierellaceae bacterium]|nr:hypothetical protein [Tissierellaceae bacterium]
MSEKDIKKEEKKTEDKPKTTKKPTPKKSPAKKKEPAKTDAEKAVEKITKEVSQPAMRAQRDMNEMISVICITNSPLVYESRNQLGYRVDWDGYLSENWMEYKELVNMRGTQRAFFENPWIICDWDVLEDLKVTHYYKNIIDLDDLDGVFKLTPKKLEDTLKVIPRGIKQLVVDRAYELRRNGELDSIKTIEVIEKTLEIDLTV